ncbi:MAG TPA: hypothetical protein VN670_05730, partial [Acidobacteriaceae bacterium]|nr:hypothetical protein [Acidobacteriaceae bacterium]
IAAQDNFFSPHPVTSAQEFLVAMRQRLDSSLASPDPPAAVTIAGRPFAEFTYTGAGLQHAVFATQIRCHTLIISVTAGSPEAIHQLISSLDGLSAPAIVPRDKIRGNSEHLGNVGQPPICIRNYATAEHILHRVDPIITGPKFGSVPVRIIIDSTGRVAQVHPITGAPEQASSVADALSHWTFKPYLVNGKAKEIETGLLFQFPQTRQ